MSASEIHVGLCICTTTDEFEDAIYSRKDDAFTFAGTGREFFARPVVVTPGTVMQLYVPGSDADGNALTPLFDAVAVQLTGKGALEVYRMKDTANGTTGQASGGNRRWDHKVVSCTIPWTLSSPKTYVDTAGVQETVGDDAGSPAMLDSGTKTAAFFYKVILWNNKTEDVSAVVMLSQ